MSYKLNNTLIVSIYNDYAWDKKNEISAIANSATALFSELKEGGYRISILQNKSDVELDAELDKIVSVYGNHENRIRKSQDKIDVVIISYVGHAFYSKDDNFAGIYTQNMKKIGLTNVLSKFKVFDKLVCYFDGCRSFEESDNVNYDMIQNKFQLCLFPTKKGLVSRGMILNKSFASSIILQKDDFLTEESILNLSKDIILGFISRWFNLHKDLKLPVSYIQIPKIYVNSYVRDHYPQIIKEIQNITNQSFDSIRLSIVNDTAELARMDRDIAIDERRKKEKFITNHENKLSLVERLDELVKTNKLIYEKYRKYGKIQEAVKINNSLENDVKNLNELKENIDKNTEKYNRYMKDLGRK